MLRALWLLALVLAVACGGGGSTTMQAGGVVPLPATLRTDLLYGYFAQDSTTAVENQPHTNLMWLKGDLADQAAALMFANGRSVVLQLSLCPVPVPVAQGEANARAWLQRLHDAGALANIAASSWCDEPNSIRAGAWTDANATAMNAAVRRAMAAFPELQATRLAVIYACRGMGYPGIASVDWVSCDDYDSGCQVFARYVRSLPLLPGQRLFATIAGSDPWRLDPACALSEVENDSRYVAVVVFAWQTLTDGATFLGVRLNGMRTLYCQAGRTIVAPGQPGGCP